MALNNIAGPIKRVLAYSGGYPEKALPRPKKGLK